MFLRYFILAFVMGVIGTVLESITLSWQQKRLVYQGDKYFINFPSKPIYATGGLLLYLTVKYMAAYQWYWVVLTATLAATVWEYFGGWFCVNVLGERLWDYSKMKLNIGGHISLWSIKWWFLIVIVFYFFIFSWFQTFDNYLKRVITISISEDIRFMVLFIVAMTFLTIIRKKTKSASKKRRR